jgi:hypothetical protein
MKIYMPSAALKSARREAVRAANKNAARQWHPKRVLFARLGDEDVRILEVVDRRLSATTGNWEYRERPLFQASAPVAG